MAEKNDFYKINQRPVQYFNQGYIDQCQHMSHIEIIEKITEQQNLFWSLQNVDVDKSCLISLKVNDLLLEKFKEACESHNLKYQTQIKKLMMNWVLQNN